MSKHQHQQTTDDLAGRDDLAKAELLALRNARRAQAPAEEVVIIGDYTVALRHHAVTHGKWYVEVTDAGKNKPGVGGPFATRAEATAAAERFIAAGCPWYGPDGAPAY